MHITYKKRVWPILFGAGVIGFSVMLALLLFYQPKSNILKMHNNPALQKKHPETQTAYSDFIKLNEIQLFEFTDDKSYTDTLMLHYFLPGAESTLNNILHETLVYLKNTELNSDNLNEICSLLSIMGEICKRYEINSFDQDIQILVENTDRFLQEIPKSNAVLNLRWRLKKIFPRQLNDDWNTFYSYENDGDDLSNLSKECIQICEIGNQERINEKINEILDMYTAEKIDIESLIIILNIFSEIQLKATPSSYISPIFHYCYDNFFYLSPEIRYMGLQICNNYSENYFSDIKKCYEKFPIDNIGFTTRTAYIIPTYRRLYQFMEVCRVLAIPLDNTLVYSLTENINQNLMVEDYYYMSLLSLDNRQICVDREKLMTLKATAERSEISLSNCFSYYYLLKALQLNQIKCEGLYSKVQNFIQKNNESSNYLIMKLWGYELGWLFERQPLDIQSLEKEVLSYTGESEIQVYYQYAVLMLETEHRPSAEIEEHIYSKISRYKLSAGGFWANEVYRYLDLTQTYNCLFLDNFFLQNKDT